MGTQATPASEPAEVVEEPVDELTGEELFDIPEDLLDEPDTGAPAGQAADTAIAEPPASEPAAETLQLPDGYKRDARGLVHRPDGTVASKSELDKFAPAQPAAKPVEAAQPPAQPAAPVAAGQPAAAAPVEEPVQAPVLEFGFRADGKAITIPGSKVTDEGIFVPKAYVPELQRLASHGVVYQGSFRAKLEDAERRIAEAKSAVSKEVEESKHFITFFSSLLEQGPSAVQDWLDDFEKNKPQLIADAKIAYAEALTQAKQSPAQPAKVEGFEGAEEDDFLAGVDRDEMMTQLSNVLATNLREVIVTNAIRGLTDADVNRLHKAIAEDPEEMERYFAVATEDVPELQAKKGDVLVRQAALLKRVQYEASLVSSARKAVTDASAADAANKKRAAGGGAPPPPTAAVAGGVTQKKKEVPIPTKREDLDAFMAADD